MLETYTKMEHDNYIYILTLDENNKQNESKKWHI
jgi:hypothetical protein